MKDPYQILGVSPTATDDEIKSAYRNLARKYHPDKYRDSDLAEMAGEKMKEINAAYDEVQKIRAGKATGQNPFGGYGGQTYGGQTYGGYGGYGGQTYGEAHHNGDPYAAARQFINLRRIVEAEQILSTIPAEQRGAEWHFLMGCIAVNRGHYVDAQHFFDTACGMDPANPEYREAQTRLRNRASGFSGNKATRSSPCSCCGICTALACADCCCDLCAR
jgi:curved DNA-binding protein CbpA